MATIHTYKIKGIDGKEIDFSAFKGKKILAVNVASRCGLTPQYAQLQELYTHFQDKVVVVGFPSNDFANQEPAEDAEIQQFCQTTYNVSFPITTKIHVTGHDKHPVYTFLTEKSLNDIADTSVEWNFQKYVLNEDGELTRMFPPSTEPFDDRLLQALELEL